MRVLLKVLAIVLIILFFLSTLLFAVLFVVRNNETNQLKQDIMALQDQLANQDDDISVTDSCESCIVTNKFVDEGLGIEIEYPSTWTGVLNSKILTEFVYDPVIGVVAQEYVYTLTNTTAELRFEKILRAIDGYPTGLETGVEYVELSPTLLRYKANNASPWMYVSKLDCSEYVGEPFDLSAYDVCISPFFGGFGDTFAANVALYIDDSTELLNQADQIVLSAQN